MLSRLLSLDRPAAIAHRGGSKLKPENTMPAFAHAVALGVDALECDVQLSSDGVPVIIHDSVLERTTDASGPVAARTARDLSGVNAAAHFVDHAGQPLCGERPGVPRLAELLHAFPDQPVIVEIKGERTDAVARVLAVIQQAGAEDRVIVGGFSDRVLATVRDEAPRIITSASRGEVQAAMRRAWFRWAPSRPAYRLFQMPVRLGGRTILRRHFVAVAVRAGIPVHAWIVDDPAEMRKLLEWGVTGLISDRPDLARAIVAGTSATAGVM